MHLKLVETFKAPIDKRGSYTHMYTGLNNFCFCTLYRNNLRNIMIQYNETSIDTF